MTTPTVDSAVGLYRKLREMKETIEHDADEKVATIKQRMLALENWLSEKAKADGVEGFNTVHGTVFWKQTAYCNVVDWNAIFGYIQQSGKWDLLTHGVSKDAVTTELKLTGAVPPGLNYGTKRTMQVNKPRVKE